MKYTVVTVWEDGGSEIDWVEADSVEGAIQATIEEFEDRAYGQPIAVFEGWQVDLSTGEVGHQSPMHEGEDQ